LEGYCACTAISAAVVVLSTFFQLTAAASAYESHVSHNQPEQQCDQIFTLKLLAL
jgi:hypothetical protein